MTIKLRIIMIAGVIALTAAICFPPFDVHLKGPKYMPKGKFKFGFVETGSGLWRAFQNDSHTRFIFLKWKPGYSSCYYDGPGGGGCDVMTEVRFLRYDILFVELMAILTPVLCAFLIGRRDKKRFEEETAPARSEGQG